MSTEIKKTPLYALHARLEGKMVPFAGYCMPLHYALGIKAEHEHTRQAAGLFDVSHMGQILVTGKAVAQALERLLPVDVVDLAKGRQRYAFFTNEAGGILDDLMITNMGHAFYLVVNATRKKEDVAHLRSQLPESINIEQLEDRALLALQGPRAAQVLQKLIDCEDMKFMDARTCVWAGAQLFVARAGYTGEDGFEISLPVSRVQEFAEELLSFAEVKPVGLGARDSLRLEAGLCLYGQDIDLDTTPIEAGLLWAISKKRRTGGERSGNFLGADLIVEQIEQKNYARTRVGLKPEGRAIFRQGVELFSEQGEAVGRVCSGCFGPSFGGPIAMGYVAKDFSAIGQKLYGLLRSKKCPVTVHPLPFVSPRYHR